MRIALAVLLALVVLVTSHPAAADRLTHGVQPHLLALYKTDLPQFRCHDGAKSVPFDRVNDNYCDCRDGSDEPGTSACGNGKFYCKNDLSSPKTIFSSRVADGICDCCDGSDEYDFHFQRAVGQCSNTCKEEGASVAEAIMVKLKVVEEGLKAKEAAKNGGEKIRQDKVSERVQLTAEVLQLGRSLVEAEASKNAAQIAHDQKKNALRIELNEKFGVKATDATAKEEEKKDEDDEWAEDDAPVEGEAGYGAPAPPPPPATEETPEQKVEAALGADDALRTLTEALNKATEAESTARNAKSEKERQIADINKFLEIDFGPGNIYANLHNVEIKKQIGEYEYKLVFFGNADQSTTSIGHFSSWSNPHTVMSYKGGQMCWGGPERSVDVSLECGSQNEILDVREPNKCAYAMSVTTPFACHDSELSILRNKLPVGWN